VLPIYFLYDLNTGKRASSLADGAGSGQQESGGGDAFYRYRTPRRPCFDQAALATLASPAP
jgi:hypothetical protein